MAEFQFIDFISAGFDLLTNYAAKCRYRWGANIPAVFRGPCGSGVRSGPFHSLNAEAFFLNTAGLKIVEPSTAYDAKGLIKAAIRDPDPVLYFEHKKLYRLPRLREELPADDYIVEIGKARTAREGRDLSIITFGAMVLTALDAAEELEKEGLDVEVIDLRTLAPLDKPAILASVKKTSRVIVLHEASRTGGIGGEIAATSRKRRLNGSMRRWCALRRSIRRCRIRRRWKITICRRRRMWWMRRGSWRRTESRGQSRSEVRGQRSDLRSEI